MRLRLVRLLGVTAICLSVSAVPAQASSEWIISMMSGVMRPDATWEQVWSQMLYTFYQSNPDERGVSAQGIDNLRRVSVAWQRTQVIAQILSYDLDGDGNVTKDEIIAVMRPRARELIEVNGVRLEPTPQQVRLRFDRLVSNALRPDSDGDGIITAAEIQKEAQKRAYQADLGWRQGATLFIPMTLDADGDGVVSPAEYQAEVRKQFDAADQDRDGRVSEGEYADFNKRLGEARETLQRARAAEVRALRFQAAVAECDVPPAPPGVRLVLLGAYQGKALSSAWIATHDSVTSVTTVEIVPGREPLYLALASYDAMIWDIVGATERIAGIVAHAEFDADPAGLQRDKPLVGVIGVARGLIRFTAHAGCLVPVTEETIEDGSARDIAALLLGRAPDETAGAYNAGAFRVPAVRHFPDRPVRNAIPLPKKGRGEMLWREVEEEFPAGIAQIDVASVISTHAVKPYTGLPGRAGLAELVDAGALTIAGISERFRLDSDDPKPFMTADEFRIVEKVRLPARPSGRFILSRGVAMPEGDLSRICLLTETDMKPVKGSWPGCK